MKDFDERIADIALHLDAMRLAAQVIAAMSADARFDAAAIAKLSQDALAELDRVKALAKLYVSVGLTPPGDGPRQRAQQTALAGGAVVAGETVH